MKNKYELLRAAMRSRYMTISQIAEKIGRSESYAERRMSGARQWELSDMYAIMSALDIPVYQMPAFFPKDGISVGAEEVCPPLTEKQAAVIAAYEQADEMQPAVDRLLGLSGSEHKKRACAAAAVTGSGRENRFGFCLDYSR